ncbi:MAG: anthranilate phosphoribosyltransferase [Alphaproteobacteria bacterium]|nr:anthranilate phosphoribosyltransferase [Alphaproteobacteria bacterium]
MPLTAFTDKLRDGGNLSAVEAEAAFGAIFTGGVADEALCAFLAALHNKGETAEEILGAVRSMRAKAVTISAPAGAIDIVGTGGDGRGTLNISTATAFVVAACGVPVAKHGNRAATSKSGSSDVLAALGVNLDAPFPVLEECLAEIGLCFLFAPRHHPAMRHVVAARKAVGTRTIFNLLGPLTNPANVKRHLIGVYEAAWLRPMAGTLSALGSEAAWVAHGQDGTDEISISTASDIVALKNGGIEAFSIAPAEAGLALSPAEAIKGGEAAANAEALRAVLAGAKNAYCDAVIFNAAAALVMAGKASSLRGGAAMATQAIDNGAAQDILDRLVHMTNKVPA